MPHWRKITPVRLSWIEYLLTLKTITLYVLALLLVALGLLAIGLPYAALMCIFALFAAAALFLRKGDALLAAVSFVFTVVIANLVLSLTGMGDMMYYRPTERYRINDNEFGRVLQPKLALKAKIPFGDLEATAKLGIIEPREIEFISDKLGFRNRQDYAGQPWVLVGDSFGMGEGDTQACMVNEVLARDHGLAMYNLSHSGDGQRDYLYHMQAFDRVLGDQRRAARYVLMVFEGNDFFPSDLEPYPTSSTRPFRQWFQNLSLWRFTRWLYERRFKRSELRVPLLHDVAGERFAFQPDYADLPRITGAHDDAQLKYGQIFAALKGRVSHIVFVPEKYRVFHPFINGATPLPVPNQQVEYLRRIAAPQSIPVLDLTDAMVAAQRAALQAPLGKRAHVFWRADTHWTCAGQLVAANEIARLLQVKP